MNPISLGNVVRTYRFYAPIYDFLFGAVLEPGRKAMLGAVCSLHPCAVLEVGVGTGLTLSNYPADAAFVGIDVSEEMLDLARVRSSKMTARNIQLMSMDAESMTFSDNSFDCVTVPYVLSVTPNPDQLIAEIRRVCRPGGTIFILNHFSGSHFWWLLERVFRALAAKIGFRSDFSFEEQILKHDWDIQSTTSVNLLGLSKLVRIRNI